MASDSYKPDIFYYEAFSRNSPEADIIRAYRLLYEQYKGLAWSLLKKYSFGSFEDFRKDMESAYDFAIATLIVEIQDGYAAGPASIRTRLYRQIKWSFLDSREYAQKGRHTMAQLTKEYAGDATVDELVLRELRQEEEELRRAIRQGIALLSDQCNKILTRFYYEHQSFQQIARELGIREASARNRSYECKKQLRIWLVDFLKKR